MKNTILENKLKRYISKIIKENEDYNSKTEYKELSKNIQVLLKKISINESDILEINKYKNDKNENMNSYAITLKPSIAFNESDIKNLATLKHGLIRYLGNELTLVFVA